ncbi:unnamed protein product [Microthlaspi erraticum]|uniref:Uncharacterized protein n=1 Tax=Microthlaspi erraticum TaxID=1685480 RepID=A0A6D2I7T0_9BRAS|nr:unnamed protein product [Microthlaspi erraticum]
MVSKALLLVGLFAAVLVVSQVATASERQSGTVTSKSTEETLHPDQVSYGAELQRGVPWGGAYRSRSPLPVVIFLVFMINLL